MPFNEICVCLLFTHCASRRATISQNSVIFYTLFTAMNFVSPEDRRITSTCRKDVFNIILYSTSTLLVYIIIYTSKALSAHVGVSKSKGYYTHRFITGNLVRRPVPIIIMHRA